MRQRHEQISSWYNYFKLLLCAQPELVRNLRYSLKSPELAPGWTSVWSVRRGNAVAGRARDVELCIFLSLSKSSAPLPPWKKRTIKSFLFLLQPNIQGARTFLESRNHIYIKGNTFVMMLICLLVTNFTASVLMATFKYKHRSWWPSLQCPPLWVTQVLLIILQSDIMPQPVLQWT